MPKLPSSKQIIGTLMNHGFVFISKIGSHSKFRKENRIVIVPSPNEVTVAISLPLRVTR
jgi:predicted RNA binding protein YcfA (HicA-like mRNA interferase family)